MKKTLWSSRLTTDELLKMYFGTWEQMMLDLELDFYEPEAERDRLVELLHEYHNFEVDFLREDLRELNGKLEGDIIGFADLGFWNGRQQGYQKYGRDLASIISGDYYDYDFHLDAYNLKSILYHHDGRHYVTYRQLKKELTDQQIENFYEKLENFEITQENMGYYTRSLKPLVERR